MRTGQGETILGRKYVITTNGKNRAGPGTVQVHEQQQNDPGYVLTKRLKGLLRSVVFVVPVE